MTLIEKLVLNKKITNEEVEDELVGICSKIHHLPSGCHNGCLVYKINGNKRVGEWDDCDCFLDGHKMRMFIIFKNRENKKNLIESEK